MSRVEVEKALKRYLKRSVGYSTAILIGFLIDGQISLGADINKELLIQELLKDLKIEKNELQEKLLELDKEISLVINSEDKSTHFLFSPKIERRRAKDSDDNGFSNMIEEWEKGGEDKPNIEIPDIRDNIKPDVSDIPDPLPNEENLVVEPEFDFNPVGNISMDNIPEDVDITIDNIDLPVESISGDDFNGLDNSIAKPDVTVETLENLNIPTIDFTISPVVSKPEISDVGDLEFFEPPEVNVNVGDIPSPESFSLDTVKIETGTFTANTTSQDNATNPSSYVVQNYNRYVAPKNKDGVNKEGFNIWVNENGIYYDTNSNTDPGRKEKPLTVYNSDGSSTTLGFGQYIGEYADNATATAFINDSIGEDVNVEGDYSLTYEGSRNISSSDTTKYVRTFLSSSSNGLIGEMNAPEKTKLTEFSGELNLATTNNGDKPFFGNLVGLEHQLWDKIWSNNSILLNSGEINLGVTVKGEGSTEEVEGLANKNMIGIMIDSANSFGAKLDRKNQTINAGEINILQEDMSANAVKTQNNIGISFEEYGSKSSNSDAKLKDEVYIGKINIGEGTTKNYGFSMGNIYKNSAGYFDDTEIIGRVDGDSVVINNNNDNKYDDTRDPTAQSNIKDGSIHYESDIIVKGSQNVGMVVGKSVSNGSPINNFKNIHITVDGDQTIGFVRDKNYSNNNTTDMDITDGNLKNVKFGENAKNSVLFRSEHYGITNATTLDVTGAGDNNTTNDYYNTAMQGMVQSWDSDGDGTKDINSAGSVTNKRTISGEANRVIGLMASGTVEQNIDSWHNNYTNNNRKALASNEGTISLTGKNNIGMAILDGNSGKNSSSITVEGDNGIGIYNTGDFFASSGDINVSGKDSIGIYNSGNLNFTGDTAINIGENTTGIYSEGGTLNFNNNNITITGENANTGIYTKGDTAFNGNLNISGAKAGVVSQGGTLAIDGNLKYSGNGFALHTKDSVNNGGTTKGKINFTSSSTLTLGGNAYGFNIVDTLKEGQTEIPDSEKSINFNNGTIKVESNDVTIFNINGNGKTYSTIDSGGENLPGEEYLEKFVGEIKEIITSGYEGYKIASIENGIINLNSDPNSGKNEEFLKKYKYQKSKVNVVTDTNLTLNNSDANTYFKDEVIGIGISSTSNIDKNASGEDQRSETQININNSTLTANRSEASNKSTIGTYIDFGEINLTDGHIVVENEDPTGDTINNNGIGIYSKNGSKITTDADSSITVYGDNGTGIYGEATDDIDGSNTNRFGGKITSLEIDNKGSITLGDSGIGIYADNSKGDKNGVVTNSGAITVGTGTQNNSSIGIYGDSVDIKNSGNITVGGVGTGIYGEDSNITLTGNTTMNLGENTTGIYLNRGNLSGNNNTLTFKSIGTTSNDVIGIYVDNSEFLNGSEAVPVNIDFNIDMGSVENGKAIVGNNRVVVLNTGKTLTISGDNGRGMRALNHADVTNNGTINISRNNNADSIAVGMISADSYGAIENNGTININSNNGIGIYVENNGKDKLKNKIESIGTINLTGDNNRGVVAKGSSLDLTAEDIDGITFATTSNKSVGILGDSSSITLSGDITKSAQGKNNILIAGVNSNIENNSNITLEGNDGNNTAIYLGEGSTYSGSGSVTVKNGATGIYAVSGSGPLENLKVTSDSQGVQTIGVLVNGSNSEEKVISGNITLQNTATANSNMGKNIGVYANNSNIVVNDTLTFNHDTSNGTSLYLNDSILSGSGTVKITGEGKANQQDGIPYSVGIYYKSDTQPSIVSKNQVKVEIDKSNTIGVYVADGNSLTKSQGGGITIGKDNKVTEVTGILAGSGSTINNDGYITLTNSEKSTGIASLGGTVNNSGTITIRKNSVSGTGAFLSGNSTFDGANGDIVIEREGTDTDLGIGIYSKGEDVAINSTGKFNMAKGNIAVYSEGTNISTDINLANKDDLEENRETTALVIKSDRGVQGATEGTTVNGMDITLAKGSTGIYALDSGVKISDVSIDAKANDGKDGTLYSSGIYLGADNGGNYQINNTDISLVKGIGIVVKESEAGQTDANLTLTDSTIDVDSYSEGRSDLETGIGIYSLAGDINLNGGNTLNISNGIGIYGGSEATITTNADTLNLQGYSVGIYSRGGKINLGDGNITFTKGIADPVNSGIYQGVGAYSIDGSITSSATITNSDIENTQGVVGLLAKQSDSTKNISINNSGDITLSGKSVIGIAGIGSGTITNSGDIKISGALGSLATGIYGENIAIDNSGNIEVGDVASGIFYTGTVANNISSNNINITGSNSLGAVLKGVAGDVKLGDITSSVATNLGVYLDNYKDNKTEIGNITLGDQSMGLYANNSNTTIDKIGDITAGAEGIGIASIGDSKDGADTITISDRGTISVGDKGTGIYVEDSTLNINTLGNIEVGNDGTFVHVNNGSVNVDSTIDTLTVDKGNIGMILENGGNITAKDGTQLNKLNIEDGAVGIIVRGENTHRPDILAEGTTLTLGSGEALGNGQYNYSVGIYYQNADVIKDANNNFALNVQYQNGATHTIATIYDRTYGTINNYNDTIDDSVSYSIGNIIRRDNYNSLTDSGEVGESVTLNAGANNLLLKIDGEYNIGILGKNSVINANGDIEVGVSNPNAVGAIGVYLTGNDKNWEHRYTGIGDLKVGADSTGIFAKNYDVVHNGNIEASGKNSVGIASVILDKDGHDHPHEVTVKGNSLVVKDGAIGVFGRDTNISATGDLNVTGTNSTGIASLEDGEIVFNGSASISGKGSAGIYMNSVPEETDPDSTTKLNSITVGKGEWNISDTASGIVALSRDKINGSITGVGNSIEIKNSANMNLGAGAIGIYSAGKNSVFNEGDITVGGAKDELNSIGIYMVNGVGGTNPIVEGNNSGNITAKENGGAGILVSGYIDFNNTGDIQVANGAEGIHVSLGAHATNTGTITVTGQGTGMLATEKDSVAINKGVINLEAGNGTYSGTYNTSLVGMLATNGGHIINDNGATINVNDGVGMYIDENSTFANNGTINVNSGVGIMGVGALVNTGTIKVDASNPDAVGTVELDDNLADKGSIVIDRDEKTLIVNNNYTSVDGILETGYNLQLKNPTVDITAGGAGFIAPNISGDIRLHSNFMLAGNGISYTAKDFIDPEANVKITTSPLAIPELTTNGDLTVHKAPYRDVTVGTQFDNRDNSLDNILAGGGVDSEILKNLNYYLDSLGNTPLFYSESDRLLGAIGGNIYSNVQSRMQDISRNFDSSFDEMLEDPNPTIENTKYHLIYTDGEYENTNKNVVDYDYNVKGLNTMKEYELPNLRYGYTFGFTGTEFKFDDSFDSEEDVYSLRGGAHRIATFENGVSWLTRGEVGYNHHRVERKFSIPGASENGSIKNRDWYGSYQVSLDNKLRKELLSDEKDKLGVYTALNLEYGRFDDIEEKGELELKVKSNDYLSSKAVVGVDGKYSKPLNDQWTIRVNGDINYSYDFGNNYDNNEAKFKNDGSYYSLSSEIKSRDVVSGKASISLDKSDYMSFVLHGQASKDFRRDEDYWSVGLTFIYRFNDSAVPEKFLDMHNYFDFDKSQLKAKDRENIKEMAQYMEKEDIKGTLLIEGHTDNKGTLDYNDKLSLERASVVKEEFEKNFKNKESVKFKVVGYGENKPEYENIDEDTRAKNRRAEINILNK